MERFTIVPIKTGQFLGLEHAAFTYGHNFGAKLPVPIIMYLLKSASHAVLVDTGCPAPEWVNQHHPPITQAAEEVFLTALAAHGLVPQDVSMLINTHLHWDHCFNNHYFTTQPIYIQKKEWEYALNPLPCHYVTYESQMAGFFPPFLRHVEKQRLCLIDGERTLLPGLRVIPLPGHTPGLQGVLVETEDGPRCICSDAVPLYENWEHHPRLPSGIHCDLFGYYATLDLIAALDCPILPGHDPAVFDLYPTAAQ